MRVKPRQIAASLGVVAVLAVGVVFVFVVQHVGQVRAGPDAIVNAAFSLGRRNYVRDERIIDAIKRYGNVNGFSQQQQCSFIYAAAAADRDEVLKWLLENGADPNPQGPKPLLAAINRNDIATARKLLRAGSRWDAEFRSGETVMDAARARNPVMLEQLVDGESD